MAKPVLATTELISPLNVNGLEGRVLRMAAPRGKKRNMLFIYGQHSSIERWWGLVEVLNEFGQLTMPDLPGFGGMDSLYKQGKQATIDNLADWLADFISQEYPKKEGKKITLAAMSLGFVVTTRMLQRHPEIVDRVDTLVSIVGFGDHSDFVFSKWQRRQYLVATRLLSTWVGGKFLKYVAFQPFFIRLTYSHMRLAKEKFKDKLGDAFKAVMDTEVLLWAINDARTEFKTTNEMLKLRHGGRRVNIPVLHVASAKDRYFNHELVQEHLEEVYRSVQTFYTEDPNHAPTVIADKTAARPFIPEGIRKLLSK